MARRLTLRQRIALAYSALGLILSLLFALASTYLTEDYEEIVVNEILLGQAQDYAERLRQQPDLPLPVTHRLSGYLRRHDGSGFVPPDVADLPPGIHEVDDASDPGKHAGVFDIDAGRLTFVINLNSIEALEDYLLWFMLAVVALGTAASGWVGWLLAGRTIEPVRRLSAAVDALPSRPQPTQLAGLVGEDELGRLAKAIDAYQTRLVDADAAERAFFADASHELRTPIAVVQGAAEVLLDEAGAQPALRRRLARLERGMNELTDLINVLLGLARRSAYFAGSVDARTLLEESAASLASAVEPRLVQIDIEATGNLRVPRAEAVLALRGILRRLLPPGAGGAVRLRAHGERIELHYRASTAPATPNGPDAARSDRHLGLTLIGRFAQHLGWRLEEEATETGEHRIVVRLPAESSG
ncbi:signal transduction histidine kinase [Tahibacter aquaticus]|uniref:histidine kinase n=1 Tax=Tahibacter aquaticus TaxID=520092 RepID=A0A4R6Z255_9GAMM|nr:signal transduction histidine kinase [Tahibacter aquaticus]